MRNVDVVDLFDEEIKNKEKKQDKKVQKMRLKEEKKLAKQKKKLEKQEDQDFNEYLRKIKEEKLVEIPVKNKEIKFDNIKPTNDFNIENIKAITEYKNEEKKNHTFLNVLLVILSILLIVVSVDYIVYNTLTNYVDLPTLVNSIILVCMVFFYLISIISKKETTKKFFEILSMLFIIAFMGYHLFVL